MYSLFNTQEKQIFIGNILFVICCVFYLAWWILAFKPSGGVAKTGWLLVPAGISGLLGMFLILLGILAKIPFKPLFPGIYILLGGIAAYIILLAVTVLLLERPATAELILIIGWIMLALAEINALFGSELFSHSRSITFILLICAVFIISLICYILYYRLDSLASYIDGMIPLILAALTMAGISCFIWAAQKV